MFPDGEHGARHGPGARVVPGRYTVGTQRGQGGYQGGRVGYQGG